MKKYVFYLVALLPVVVFAQNWSPIRVNDKMNYQHSDSSYISHTIWVDSIEVIPGGAKWHLNIVVNDLHDNPEIALRNQPQFLLSRINAIQNGVYLFSAPDAFQFFSLTNEGESWLFGTENNLMATVTSVSYEVVFGTMDSVKYISLSDGSEIRLSKNFGFLRFPDFENGEYFELVGIQGTEYGESVPGFWEIYDFEVGDVFQYKRNFYDVFYTVYETRKIEITEKEILAGTLNYAYEGIYSGIGYENKGGIAYPISGELTFIDSLDHPANKFFNEINVLPNSWSGYGTNRVLTRAKIYPDSVTNVIKKEFGIKEEVSGFVFFKNDVFYEFDINNDTIYRYPSISMIGDPCGLKRIRYGNALGEILSNEGCFEYEDHSRLEGYVKDGDTVGTITPDSVLLFVGINDLAKEKNEIMVYPNPADQFLNIQFSTTYDVLDVKIEIRDILGELVKKKDGLKKIERLDISQLNPGIYFYTIFLDNKIYQAKKLIIY